MSIEQTRALYMSVEDLAKQINAIRTQLNPGGKAKLVTAKALQIQYTAAIAKKKFMVDGNEVLMWGMLRSEAEKILSVERNSRFNRAGDFQRIAAPKKGNGKKPGNNPT